MSWTLQPACEAFPAFAAEWDRLNRELYDGHPYFDSRFVGPLIECFGCADELLCIHKTSEATDGALVLRPRGFGRWALFQPSQAQIGAVLLRDGSLLETLFTVLPGLAISIDLLALDPLFSPEWRSLSLPRITAAHALTMAVDTSCTFEDYWQGRPNKLRSNLRRYQKRAANQYGVDHLAVTDDPASISAAVARYGELETSGWKGKAGTAIAIDNIQGQFYEKVLRNFAATGQAVVLELYVGSRLAASRLIIRNDRMQVMLKTTYDESLGDVAPGRQLLYRSLQLALSSPKSGSVEFYTNTAREQAEWASSFRYIRHKQIFRHEVVAETYQLLTFWKRGLLPGDDSGRASRINFPASSVKSYRTIADVPQDARDLFAATARDNVECSPGWFANLEQTVFADETGVRYYVSRVGKQCQTVLPLRLTHDRWTHRIEALGNFYTSLYAPALSETATALDLTNVLQEAIREHSGAHVMRFSPMDAESPVYEMLLTALRSIGWIPFGFFCFGNWYQKVETGWQDYLMQRDGQLRNTIKRKGKKFAVEGGTLGIVTGGAELEPGIEAYNAVYAVSWKKPEPYPEFIPGLIRWLAARGWLRLGVARINGRPVAAQLWIVSHGKASIFKLAYDEEYAEYAPGTLLTAHLMQHAIERDRVREIDYLIGDDPYKASWMSHRRERWGVVAYNPRTAMGLALLTRETLGRAWAHLSHKTSVPDAAP